MQTFLEVQQLQAQYADLAEVYLNRRRASIGTVVVLGGKAEVLPAKVSDFAIGVISRARLLNEQYSRRPQRFKRACIR